MGDVLRINRRISICKMIKANSSSLKIRRVETFIVSIRESIKILFLMIITAKRFWSKKKSIFGGHLTYLVRFNEKEDYIILFFKTSFKNKKNRY